VVLAAAAGWVALEHFRRPAEVAPYSAADRRLTFAVLPFESPKGDPQAERLAGSARETVQSLQEARFLFARVTPQPVVQQAVGTPATFKQVGSTLNVHFLFRGSVARDASGYTLALAVVDADSERVLETKTLRAEPADAPTFKRTEIDAARSLLTFAAIQAEVARARVKPDSTLDIRDWTLRAFVDYFSGEFDQPTAYARARSSLDRALALAPNDPLALNIFARVNLCACLHTWAKEDDIREWEKLGVAALDKYLAIRPDDLDMMSFRGDIFLKHRHYEEALAVADNLLRREPAHQTGLSLRAVALLNLRRAPEAVAASQALLAVVDDAGNNHLAAHALYAARDDTSAIVHARRAISLMARRDFADPDSGGILLILAAAEARAGHLDRAKVALQDFYAAVPAVRTIPQIKGWLVPVAWERDYEDFFNGLRLAGAGD
jgi:TolB-like protein/tetratricopeptide (TPR) repeat protein